MFNITYKKTDYNLHFFWDSGAFIWPDLAIGNRPLTAEFTKEIKDYSEKISKKYPRKYFNDIIVNKNRVDWITESYKKAVKHAYNPLLEANTTEINQNYVDQSFKIMEEQIALGGYRLADFLKDCYQESLGLKL